MKSLLHVCWFSLIIVAALAVSSFAFAAEVDSVRICALRVEFVADNNTLTTGNGKFWVDSTTTDPFAIDPAPHNRLYFQDQIQAAANYFHNVSHGKIKINGDVFPLSEKGAYHMPQPMGYYNPNTTEDAINRGLANLFVDALTVADQSGDINFSQYDLVVIFHAGVGKDVDVGFDTTPQDISSLFIASRFLKAALGSGFDGVAVNQGQKKISSAIILPETENQDGYAIALTGMFVSNIGSYLGLYDLFSSAKQRTGIGRFGLMDVGLLNANGLIPAPPEGFSRELLKWDEPLLVSQPQNGIELARVGSANAQSKPTLVRIPISNDEYYLLEYRGDAQVKIDSLFNVLAEKRTEWPTYLEILKTYFPDRIEMGASGVLLSVPDYDWGLPGAGLLIWHIDERVIAQQGADNKINDDPNSRAVDLEEADGAQDIGQIYSLLEPGYQTELGTLADFWFSNRPKYLKNFERYKNEFSNSSAPNTRANLNNAFSHITIKNFSANSGETMRFDFSRDFYEPGFPISLKLLRVKNRLIPLGWYTVAGKVENTDRDFYFVHLKGGSLRAIGSQAKGLFDDEHLLLGSTSIGDSLISIALGDENLNGKYDKLFAASDDSLFGFDLTKGEGPSFHAAELFSPIRFPAPIISPLVTQGARIYLICANDSIYTVDFSGNIIAQIAAPLEIKDLVIAPMGYNNPKQPIEISNWAIVPSAQSGLALNIYFSAQTSKFIIEQTDNLAGSVEFGTSASPVGQFAVADVDGNGVYDIVFNADDGIYAVNHQGFPVSNFPIKPELQPGESLIGTPLILDADADGQLDFIAATDAGQILAFNSSGKMLSDFPLATGDSIANTPVVLQLDDDAEMELMAITHSGTVYAWQLQVREDNPLIYWTQENLDATNNALIWRQLAYQPISNDLMPSERVYNYPNPNREDFTIIRYYLNEDASVKIRIFDTAGAPVDDFSAPGAGGVDNEARWDVADVASGVYLCQVEAKAGGRSSVKIIKIMVVH